MNFDIIGRIRGFYDDSKHVMSVSYKPDTETFKRTLKIVLIGIVLLGVLGFVISFIINDLVLATP